uniref:C2 domain-containing protein n=2 Tax=Plectus sambesii TaxID=2011161 RepID=A0A914X2A9_9BILA
MAASDRLLRRLEAIPECARFVTAIVGAAAVAPGQQHPHSHETRAVAVQPMPSADISCSVGRSPRRESQPPPPCRRPSQDIVDSATQFLERRRSSEQTIGAIQPDLYRRRGSVVTQQSLKGLAIGRVQLKLDYDFAKSDLVVSVLDAKDISSKIDEFFLNIFLGPEEDGKRRESVKRKKSQKNREGHFERQDIKFPITYDELLDKRLVIQFFDCGRLGRMQSLAGEVSIDLSSLDLSADLVVWADVENKSGSDNYGDVLVALTYLPSVERLTVTLHQARDLRKMDITGGADPYVKVALALDGKVTKKRKTSVRKNTLAPVWNEALNFNLSEKALKKTTIELQIMDHDLIGNDDTMGLVSIAPDSPDSKAQFMWEDFANGKSSAPTWLKLYPCPAHKRRPSS